MAGSLFNAQTDVFTFEKRTTLNIQNFQARLIGKIPIFRCICPLVDSRAYAYPALRLIKYYFVVMKIGLSVEVVYLCLRHTLGPWPIFLPMGEQGM